MLAHGSPGLGVLSSVAPPTLGATEEFAVSLVTTARRRRILLALGLALLATFSPSHEWAVIGIAGMAGLLTLGGAVSYIRTRRHHLNEL